MGLIGSIVRLGGKTLGYGKRIAKVTPEFLLGDSSEIIGKAMRSQKGSLFEKGKAGFKALELHNMAQTGNFFTRSYKSLASLPADIIAKGKSGIRLARITGKNSILGAAKGGMKAFAKRMPLIGALLTVGLEVPNIYSAFKDKGFVAGMKEIGGAGIELGGMAAGAAIGSAICPGIGTLVGSVIGGIAGMFMRGETHSEKKAAEEAAQKEAQNGAQTQPVEYSKEDLNGLKELGLTPEDIAECQAAGLSAQEVQALVLEQIQLEIENYNAQQQIEALNTIKYDDLNMNYLNKTMQNQTMTYPNINNNQTGLYNPFSQAAFNQGYQNGIAGPYANDILYNATFPPMGLNYNG